VHHHQIKLAFAQALEHRIEAFKAMQFSHWAAQPETHLLGLSRVVIEDGYTHGAETGWSAYPV
jgi:hypothetical protein